MGWGIAQLAIMINTVAVYAYCNDSFPKHQVLKNVFFKGSSKISNSNSKSNCIFFFVGRD